MTSRSIQRLGLAALLCGLISVSSSCATIVGTVVGPFTTAVDLPRHFLFDNEEKVGEAPALTAFYTAFLVPIGFVTGPLFGFAKGLTVDVRAGLQDKFPYSEGWSGGENGIWRPATFNSKTMR